MATPGSVLRRRPPTPALLAALGGCLVALGACLPWMSLFAGLVPLRGVIGLNGRVLLASGIAAIALATNLARVDNGGLGSTGLPRSLAALYGIAVTATAVWLLIGVWQLSHGHGANLMLAPQPGPGLFVVALGGLVLVLAAFRAPPHPTR